MPDYMDSYDDDAGEFGADFGEESFDGVMVGIPLTSIATLLSAQIRINVTQKFRAERLILNAAGRTALVDVTQVSISSIDQNRGDGPVPGEVFTPDATHRLRGTIVDPGVGIVLTVFNGSAGTVVIGGGFFGPAVAAS